MVHLYIIAIKHRRFKAIYESNYLKYNMFLICFPNRNKLFL